MKKDFLKEIAAKKQERINLSKAQLSEEDIKNMVKDLPATRPFVEAISRPRQICLIAEIKKASPSRGIIREDFNVVEIARAYESAGVNALSVLTEEDYFSGNPGYINEVKSVTGLPVLRKDFILEPYQIYESRLLGADAVLLIADLLTKEKLVSLMEAAKELDLDCLVEVHTEKELKKVLGLKVALLGINNRDLHTLEVDLKTTEKLYTLIPKDKTVVVESGIKTHQEVLFLKVLGVNACLVGEVFMSAADIRAKVEEVMGW